MKTLDSHLKVVPWVLGKLFYVVTGPQASCEVRMDHVVGPLHILLAEKEERIWFDIKCLNSINLRELLGGVCLSWNMSWNLF